jgi:plastocyanin
MRKWIVVSMLLAAAPVGAATLEGQVALVVDGKPLRAEEAAEAVVYFRPAATPRLKPPAKPFEMRTWRKRFEPRILPIVAGSKVSFPNQDPILHNAFSTSKGHPFDVGLYGAGEEHTVAFDRPGYVRVYCNVHHSMVAHILVLDTPHFTRPGSDGRFRLRDLPAGQGDLVVWHDRATPWQARVEPGKQAPLDVRLELKLKRIPPHMNKFGKPYGRSGDGTY